LPTKWIDNTPEKDEIELYTIIFKLAHVEAVEPIKLP
jgi:hypothetical protein